MKGLRAVSLLWKILLSTSVSITLLFAVIGWIVQDQFVRVATASLEEEVRGSFGAYESLWEARTDQLASVAMVLSRMPDVRAAFGTGDAATIRDSTNEIWTQVARRKGLFLVTDARGAVVAASGEQAAAAVRDVPAVRDAAARFPEQATGIMFYDRRLFQTVITPVYVASSRGPALLNVLVTGFPVDAALARELRAATGGSEFVFLSGGEVAAASLTAQAAGFGPDAGAQPVVEVGGQEYLQFSTAMKDVAGGQAGRLIILRSFAGARNRIAELRVRMVVLWGLAVLTGLSLTLLLTRRLVSPILALDEAAARIAAGHYDVQVSPEGDDEIGRLARTFNAMCASLRSAWDELIRRERISTINRLSTSIIHDLRNPLAAIYGGAEMMMDTELSPAQSKRLAANIYRSSRRVQELLQELAGVAGGHSHAREVCRLREVVEAAREATAQAAEERGVEVEVDIDPEVELSLDRSPMERLFQNLLGNSIEAMPQGGRVRVVATPGESAVLVTVEDNGPGIAPELMPRLFHPFASFGKKNGMGLGLALSRQTALDHGGDLWLDSSFGQGARFWLRLPA